MSVATPRGTTLRKLGKSWGGWLLLGLIVIVVLSQVFGYERQYDPLDPRSPQPDGTRAIVEVLKQQGVDVELAYSADRMPDLDENTTLMVSDSIEFSYEVREALPTFVNDAGRVVFGNVSSLYDLQIHNTTKPHYAGSYAPARDSSCSDFFGGAKAISSGDSVIDTDEEGVPEPPRTCFYNKEGPTVGIWPATADHPEYVWALSTFFQNNQLTEYDNAAAALTILGNNDRLVWFFPTSEFDFKDRTTAGVWSLLPRWSYSTALLLLFVALAFMFFRGRRFGPLAFERLPVTVKSSETVIQHGHLVHETRDAAWAISALQTRARRKIRKALLLPDAIGEDKFVNTVASRTDRSEQEIYKLLFAPFTGAEHQIIQRAKELDDLVEEVVHD